MASFSRHVLPAKSHRFLWAGHYPVVIGLTYLIHKVFPSKGKSRAFWGTALFTINKIFHRDVLP